LQRRDRLRVPPRRR
jgi:hypothetical protein